MATTIAYISREWPADMIRGLEEGLMADLQDAAVGRVSAAKLTIDADRGRAIVDIVGEVCEGEVALRIFTGENPAQAINAWISESGIEKVIIDLVRADGRVDLHIQDQARRQDRAE